MKNNREYKGKSIIDFPNNYVVLDLETTGLSPEYDEIIEISALKIKNDKIVSKFSTLIKPTFEIDEFITNLTGITNEMLSTAPKFNTVAPELVQFLQDQIIVGHNVNFDINFLYDNLLNLNYILKNDFIDTMRISRKLNPEMKHHRLCDLIEFYNIEIDRQHRASKDCLSTNLAYLNQKKEILNKYNSYEEFAKLFKKKSLKQFDFSKLTPSSTDIDEDNFFFGKNFVFTGALEKMLRKDAAQAVVNLGGFVQNSVTKKTNFLILGNNDYCSTIKEEKSSKQKRAEELKLQGYAVEIIPENVFYDILFETAQIGEYMIYENIINNVFNHLKLGIDKSLLNSADIVLKESNTKNVFFIIIQSKSTPWRGEISDKTLAKIKTTKTSCCIIFKGKFKPEFEKLCVPISIIKSDSSIKINCDDFLNINTDDLQKLINQIFIDCFNFTPFGCCSKFNDCELKEKCLHDDPIYATACQWRKIISKEKQK